MGVSQSKTKKVSKGKAQSKSAVAVKAKAKGKVKESVTGKGVAGKRGLEPVESAEAEVPVDRRAGDRERRTSVDRRQRQEPVATERRVGERRAKVPRRRQIDPTTCERDYSGDEIEFMHALDAYKRANGRMFPTCSEILEVIRGLGYGKSTVDSSSVPALAVDEEEESADFGDSESNLS